MDLTLRRALPIVVDLVCVLAFAFGGKSAHESHAGLGTVLAIAWPYVVALAVGWVAAIWNGMRGLQVWPGGVLILVTTYALGMLLREVEGRGFATGFLIVAACFLALTMLGWRAIWALIRRRA